jgi:hypothetical protein
MYYCSPDNYLIGISCGCLIISLDTKVIRVIGISRQFQHIFDYIIATSFNGLYYSWCMKTSDGYLAGTHIISVRLVVRSQQF